MVPRPGVLRTPMCPPGLSHDAVYGRQTQSRSLSGFFCGEEGLEDLGANLLRHAGSCVGHGQSDVVTGGTIGILSGVFRSPVRVRRLDG